MSGFQLEFDTGNAAFEDDNLRPEIARILGEIAEHVEGGYVEGVIRDINGNKVGNWSMDEPEEGDEEDEEDDEEDDSDE